MYKDKGWLLFYFFSQASFSFAVAAVLPADPVTQAHAALQSFPLVFRSTDLGQPFAAQA